MNWDEPKTIYVAVALGLVTLRYLFELWLDHLNNRTRNARRVTMGR